METEIEKALKEYEKVLRETFRDKEAFRVVEIKGNPVVLVGFRHMTGTVFKKYRNKATRVVRAAQKLVKALKDAGFHIALEGPTGHYLIPRTYLFRGILKDLNDLSEEERTIAKADIPTSELPVLWWRETYGAYNALGVMAKEIHTIPYHGREGLPSNINPRYVWALRKLAEKGPVALFIGIKHIDDLHKRLTSGDIGEPTEIHKLRWEPKKLRWRLVEKIM